jgi:hypothetical protein
LLSLFLSVLFVIENQMINPQKKMKKNNNL